MEIETKQQILEKRKEIEQEVVEMLQETESDFSLEHVKDIIYNEEDNDDYQHIVAMFDRGGDSGELQNILDVVTDAWNYFPHKALNSLSPTEKLLESQNKQNKK